MQATIQALCEDKSLSDELEALLESVAAKLCATVPSPPVQEIDCVGVFGRMRSPAPHADCTPESLEGLARTVALLV